MAGHVRSTSMFEPAAFDEPIAVLERVGDEIGLAHALAYRGRVDFYTGNARAARSTTTSVRPSSAAGMGCGVTRVTASSGRWRRCTTARRRSRRFSPMRNSWQAKTSGSGRRPLRPS